MDLGNVREVDTAVVGMVFLMRRAVTTREDGSFAYAGRTDFALITRPRAGYGPGLTLFSGAPRDG